MREGLDESVVRHQCVDLFATFRDIGLVTVRLVETAQQRILVDRDKSAARPWAHKVFTGPLEPGPLTASGVAMGIMRSGSTVACR